MNKKLSVIMLSMFLLVLTFSMVAAKNPKISVADNGLEIRNPPTDMLMVGQVIEFPFHIDSKETGIALTSVDTFFCDFHLYDPDNHHIMIDRKTQADLEHGYDIEFKPDTNNFSTPGEYWYNIYCECSNCAIGEGFTDLGGWTRNSVDVTSSGQEKTNVTLWGIIFLAVVFAGLMLFIYFSTLKIDFESWNNKLQKKYENRNFVKLVFGGIGYVIMKNVWVLYYILGFVFLTLVVDLAWIFSLVSMLETMKIFLYIYTWGFILVGLLFLSKIQEWIVDFVEDLTDKKWGMKD
jgi:hypothetical protein